MTAVIGIDHVQLAMPHGGEPHARRFWVDVMGLAEVAKPGANPAALGLVCLFSNKHNNA